ncbi:MAG: hypothetical protein ABIH26_15845 [Candidatus Eisenbacteria bacterium]
MAHPARVFVIGSVVISGLLFLLLRPFFRASYGTEAAASLAYGIAVCLVAVGASFFLLLRAITASHRSFQIVFLGGILGRLVLFGGAVGAAFGLSGLNGRGAALAIVSAFVPLTALELFCIVRGRASRGARRPE